MTIITIEIMEKEKMECGKWKMRNRKWRIEK
jgi:hypothetical protein